MISVVRKNMQSSQIYDCKIDKFAVWKLTHGVPRTNTIFEYKSPQVHKSGAHSSYQWSQWMVMIEEWVTNGCELTKMRMRDFLQSCYFHSYSWEYTAVRVGCSVHSCIYTLSVEYMIGIPKPASRLLKQNDDAAADLFAGVVAVELRSICATREQTRLSAWNGLWENLSESWSEIKLIRLWDLIPVVPKLTLILRPTLKHSIYSRPTNLGDKYCMVKMTKRQKMPSKYWNSQNGSTGRYLKMG